MPTSVNLSFSTHLQLALKPLIRIHAESPVLHVIKRRRKVHALALHHIRNDKRRSARNAAVAVNKDFAAAGACRVDEMPGGREMGYEVLERVVRYFAGREEGAKNVRRPFQGKQMAWKSLRSSFWSTSQSSSSASRPSDDDQSQKPTSRSTQSPP